MSSGGVELRRMTGRAWKSLGPNGGRDRDGRAGDESGHGDMRPGEGAEVEEDGLTVLNLYVRHNDGLFRQDIGRWCEREGRAK